MTNRFELVKTTLGELSIRDSLFGEIMHNPVGPIKEPVDLYVKQCGLAQRFISQDSTRPLILFDVGLGASFNVLAVLREWQNLEGNPQRRPLHIVSFENDLQLLEFFVANIESFEPFTPFKSVIQKLLKNGSVEGTDFHPDFKWQLRFGNFPEMIQKEEEIPEVIFFDAYSPKVNPDMWALQVFEDIYKKSAQSSHETCLLTYSVATSIRAALLAAGFYVGHGDSTGIKEETTYASTTLEGLSRPLAERWFQRWQRSHQAIPGGVNPNETALFAERLTRHPQFKSLTALNT